MNTIGSIQYWNKGISIGVVLKDGASRVIHYGERSQDELELLKTDLQEAFPGIVLFDEIYPFRMECKKRDASYWPDLSDKIVVYPDPQFNVWERVYAPQKQAYYSIRAIAQGKNDPPRYHAMPEHHYGPDHPISQVILSETEIEKTTQLPPPQEIDLDAPYQEGQIVEYHGHSYRVESNRYISAKEAADLEDGWDAFDTQGYCAHLVLSENTNDTRSVEKETLNERD